MGNRCYCDSPTLLCPENNISVLEFDDGEGGSEGVGQGDVRFVENCQSCDLYGDSLTGFPVQSDECLAMLISRESVHLPRDDYIRRLKTADLVLSVRKDAIAWMEKVHAHYGFGPLSMYLSVNYLDRFISNHEIPGKAWATQLISLACLSLALKMEETEVSFPLDLQVDESRYLFESKTIQKMELLVLSTLGWRMQAVTPFSFVEYFFKKLNDNNSLPLSLLPLSAEVILNALKRVNFLGFRPSEVAAAVAIWISGRTNHPMDARSALASCMHINKDRVLRCFEEIQEMELTKERSVLSMSLTPPSPIGVLDAPCLSYTSDNSTATGSIYHSYLAFRDLKRRKVDQSHD